MKDYDHPNEADKNEQFDEMFIYGGRQNAQEEMEAFRSRAFAQSVYEKPKELISEKEQMRLAASQLKDDTDIDNRGSSGKKKKKKSKAGKDKKDCVIF